MYLFVVALHVILCVFMVLIILLQPSKGEMGAAFGGGGGGGGVFGPRGPASILQRMTTVVAVMFMATSVTLALYSNQKIQNTDAGLGDEAEELRRVLLEKQGKTPEGDDVTAPEPSEGGEEGSQP